jgi:hypothetical protein
MSGVVGDFSRFGYVTKRTRRNCGAQNVRRDNAMPLEYRR